MMWEVPYKLCILSCKEALVATFLPVGNKSSKTQKARCVWEHVCTQTCARVSAITLMHVSMYVCRRMCHIMCFISELLCLCVGPILGSWTDPSSNLSSGYLRSTLDPANPVHKAQFLGFNYLHVVELLSTLKPNRQEKEAQRSGSVTLEP